MLYSCSFLVKWKDEYLIEITSVLGDLGNNAFVLDFERTVVLPIESLKRYE